MEGGSGYQEDGVPLFNCSGIKMKIISLKNSMGFKKELGITPGGGQDFHSHLFELAFGELLITFKSIGVMLFLNVYALKSNKKYCY